MSTRKPTITTLAEYDSGKMSMGRKIGSDRTVSIIYDDQPLHINSGLVECPHGVDHTNGSSYGLITLALEGKFMEFLNSLDGIARKIGMKRSVELFGEEIHNTDDVPYYPLCKLNEDQCEQSATFLLPYSNDIPIVSVFSKEGTLIENPCIQLSNRFTSRVLLSFPSLKMDGSKLRWNCRIMQLRIHDYSVLPDGCLIYNDEAECIVELERRKKDAELPTFEVEDEDDGVNELLDD